MIKVKKRKILLLPGDGIGPEVIVEVKKIINWLNKNRSLDFEIDEDLVGGAAYDKHGTPITDEVFYKALESEAVILGAVGGPKWEKIDFHFFYRFWVHFGTPKRPKLVKKREKYDVQK